MERKSAKEQKLLQAARLLEKQNFWRESIIIYWILIRTYIFNWLYLRNISYNSTQEAILIFIEHLESREKAIKLHSLYSLSIMAEWDTDFTLNLEQFHKIKEEINTFINWETTENENKSHYS